MKNRKQITVLRFCEGFLFLFLFLSPSFLSAQTPDILGDCRKALDEGNCKKAETLYELAHKKDKEIERRIAECKKREQGVYVEQPEQMLKDTINECPPVVVELPNVPQASQQGTNSINGHEYVDLGLPSGTLWATCNVGAYYNNPESNGDGYAWGETENKISFGWDTYKYTILNHSRHKLTKYCNKSDYGNNGFTDKLTVLQASDDPATSWGEGWHMPSRAQWIELLRYTTNCWTTQNGVLGRLYSASNGQTIFLPAIKTICGNDLDKQTNVQYEGMYWSRSLYIDDPEDAWGIYFTSNECYQKNINRYYCCRVRPVHEKMEEQEVQVPQFGSDLTFTVEGVTFTMKRVEGGSFQMGSNDSDAYDSEKPVHSVTLSTFYMSETEVTQALWEAVMGTNPSNWKGDNLPVEKVSWNDCQDFVCELNRMTGKNFRLPTEAEWEFAARGGNQGSGAKYAGSFSIDKVAWYKGNSNSQTHPVATKLPNEFGLYDMNGNVKEWCSDWYGNYSSGSWTNPQGPSSGSNRVLRGGGWNNDARFCRVSYRSWDQVNSRYNNNYGFRLALPVEEGNDNQIEHPQELKNEYEKVKIGIDKLSEKKAKDVSYDLGMNLPLTTNYKNELLKEANKAYNGKDIRRLEEIEKVIKLNSGPGGASEKPEQSLTGTANGHEWVDLGLPSGTLWATCNIGASRPEDYGNYYAWGETATKYTYNWADYKYANGAYDKLTKYCNKSDYGDNGFTDNLTTLQGGDDPSACNWGGGWQTPSKAQWDELLANTTHQRTTRNGKSGRLFTSKTNGQTLFLPAAGSRWDGGLDYAGSFGFYWSRSLSTDYPYRAWYLDFGSGYCYMSSSDDRDGGFTVRPVRQK